MSLKIKIYNQTAEELKDLELAESIFSVPVNTELLHQAIVAQNNNSRQVLAHTKTRSEVAGGGKKPWKQKGTGRARAGSSRSPIWVGGGIAHGPKPRDYAERTNKKMKRLALRSALSDRAAESKVIVVEDWTFDAPSTKTAKNLLIELGVEGKALVVLSRDDTAASKSFRNLPDCHLLFGDQLNTYDV